MCRPARAAATSLRARRRSSPIPHVYEVARDRRRGGHLRGYEVGPAAAPLTSLEVSVGGRRAALPGLEEVGIHAQAHRAARGPPVEARLAEDAIQALGLCLRLDL